ncbi:MAG: pyruvate kinase [Actinomycetota bacterium]|nr:pyruvate kinase [Actinomycetota bacterium]
MRRTKIVATLGPASSDEESIDSIINAGADVLRLNLAHADAQMQPALAKLVRDLALKNGKVVSILADLPGPKLRTGPVADGEVRLEPGDTFDLYEGTAPGGVAGVTTTVQEISSLLEAKDEIFLADGQIILDVEEVKPGNVRTRVVRGGILRSGKGMHIPSAERKLEAFTRRDDEALGHALAIGADLIGLSFVRRAADVAYVKEKVASASPNPPALVAKIETRSAVENIDEIIQLADAVMVARGDLGIQLPFREVPMLQKDIIGACNTSGTPVITATQMLESMTHSPLPTRAEVNDVANSVIDGTDAVMLSEETAVGDYPAETVRVMGDIALEVELRNVARMGVTPGSDDPVSWAIARAAVQASEELRVAAILCPTRTGATARRIAAFRPSMPILALDHTIETLRPLTLVWGVVPFEVPFLRAEELSVRGLKRALDAARASGLAQPGERVTLVAGGSPPRTASTDVVRILTL